MQAYPQQHRIAVRVAIGALSVAMLTPWFAAKGTHMTRLLALQQQPHILTVCPEGPPRCQFAKIQDAIDAAPEREIPFPPYYEPGAEIRVAPGIYEENLLIRKHVILKGAGKDQTFLRLSKGGREKRIGIFIVSNPPGTAAFIEGFTIEGTATRDIGIVILGLAAAAHIRGNRFQNLLTGIYIEGSVTPGMIEENDFIIPEDILGCAGIIAWKIGRLKILRNTFTGKCDNITIEEARLNILGGVPFQAPGERIRIEGNQGGEIWVRDSAAIAIRQNAVRHIRLAEVEAALLEGNAVRRGVTIGGLGDGIWVEDSRDVVIQKNTVEENQHGITITSDPFRIPTRGASVAVISNHVVRNGWGIVTESLEYITVCQSNEVKENKKGDYGVGSLDPKPSPELKQKCEGS